MRSFNYYSLPTGLLMAAITLNSCSQAAPEADKLVDESSKPEFPFGSKVDSLNGIAGHTFGQPLSAFSDLEKMDREAGDGMDAYIYRGTTGWFGKHRQQVPSQFYYFLDGKFCQFVAVGNAQVLRTETSYLFGPDLEQAPNHFWDGQQARAVYAEKAVGFGREGRLTVLSKQVEKELETRERAHLKAENAD